MEYFPSCAEVRIVTVKTWFERLILLKKAGFSSSGVAKFKIGHERLACAVTNEAGRQIKEKLGNRESS